MAPHKSIAAFLLLLYLTATAIAGPVLHEARFPFPAGNSTDSLRKETDTPGNQTETAASWENKGISEHTSLVISASVIAAIIFFAVLDKLVAKWREHRRLTQQQNGRHDAEASGGEEEETAGSTSVTASGSTAGNNGADGNKRGNERLAESEPVDRSKPATAE